ncbi:DNA repair helicase RAD25 [Staphylothermus marinus F1]|uniref:DNA 3'-5' helicase n=1 Tax=Staphylothermus marinus (strain ATCC 43588 / DSM 3639 / JCM 9404 / F1) TaxID=399550 RepID=A3DN51_STAMF|nr:DEAD/DEAH box helicase [Staphylothermus marinus]ABN70061.1 DNA repair helicase RAD25 [Staphylothermus marinus F1]
MIIFKSKRWLENDEFKEILRVADYNGFEKGVGGVFVFNIDKALRNGYGLEDVLKLIEDYGLEIDSSSLEELKSLYKSLSILVMWNSSNGFVELHVPTSIDRRIKSVLRESGARFRGYRGDRVVYKLIPYKLWDLIGVLRGKGFEIIDRSGLLRDKKLPYKIELRKVELRPYQREALEAWIKNNGKGIVALPTGSGKTLIGIAAIAQTSLRTLIITYTREQMFQWREQIYKYTTAEPGLVGLIYSREKRLAPITITTYQSGFRNIKELSPFFDLLIVDEVHHLPADKFRYIAIHSISRYRMGLSATPVREDGRHEELFPLLGGIIYYRSAAELANMGYLARYRVLTIKVGLRKDEKKLFEDLRKTYKVLSGGRSFNEVLDSALKGDEKAKNALRIHNQMRMILAKSKSKIDKAVEIAEKEYRRGSKIIIFTQYIEQAKEIAEKLNAYLLTGEVPVEKRKRVLEEFKNRDNGILVVTTVGDEGLDIPDANVGIIVSGTGSRRQFIQRLGRILRPKPNGVEARLYEIVLEKTPEEYHARKRKRVDLDEYLY